MLNDPYLYWPLLVLIWSSAIIAATVAVPIVIGWLAVVVVIVVVVVCCAVWLSLWLLVQLFKCILAIENGIKWLWRLGKRNK